eukprot:snap_masked-scaffold_11-processed-gene-0.8-mRNA-1 protein AED:0.46 eAED:0.46 QI:0/0/0/0.5/1/1/2/0/1260
MEDIEFQTPKKRTRSFMRALKASPNVKEVKNIPVQLFSGFQYKKKIPVTKTETLNNSTDTPRQWKKLSALKNESFAVVVNLSRRNGVAITEIKIFSPECLQEFVEQKDKSLCYEILEEEQIFTGNLLRKDKPNNSMIKISRALFIFSSDSAVENRDNKKKVVRPALVSAKVVSEVEWRKYLVLIRNCIRRGEKLSSTKCLLEAIDSVILLSRFDSIILRELFITILESIFEDTRPYFVSEVDRKFLLSIEDICGLSYLLLLQNNCCFTADIMQRLKNTILALHYFDSFDDKVSWKGWQFKYREQQLREITFRKGITKGVQYSNTIVFFLSFSESNLSSFTKMIKRYYIGWVDKQYSLKHLNIVERDILNKFPDETLISSCSIQLYPSILLFLQVLLPECPKLEIQDGIKSLKHLLDRLEESLNVRAVKQKLLSLTEGNLFRISQYMGEQQTLKSNEIDRIEMEKRAVSKLNDIDTLPEIVNRTPKEQTLFKIFLRIQRWFHSGCSLQTSYELVQQPVSSFSEGNNIVLDSYTKRNIFLLLFGREFSVVLSKKKYYVILAGNEKSPFLVQPYANKDFKWSESLERSSQTRYETNLSSEEIEIIIRKFNNCFKKVSAPHPPYGFSWSHSLSKTDIKLQIRKRDCEYQFLINDSVVTPFDGTLLVENLQSPKKCFNIPSAMENVVKAFFYVPNSDVPILQLEHIQKALSFRKCLQDIFNEDDVFDWTYIRKNAAVDRKAWHNLLLKLTMRKENSVYISAKPTPMSTALQTFSNFEGLSYRLLVGLSILYPHVIQPQLNWSIKSEVEFVILNPSCRQYVDLIEKVTIAAEKRYLNSEVGKLLVNPDITTKLWKHQEEGRARLVLGVKAGRRGFADASTVGSGKTLTALSVIVELMKNKELPRSNNGSLVLLPTKSLIEEWAIQLMTHTNGVHVIVQTKTGVLKSKGVSNAGGTPVQFKNLEHNSSNDQTITPSAGPFTKVTRGAVVLTTLSRAREHEFEVPGWNFVVVDECLSVQSPAQASLAAWKNVMRSENGVLLLSATFFRSRIDSLYYMLRMIRSPFPLSKEYLKTILNEHVVLYIPKNPRKWSLRKIPVSLKQSDLKKYHRMVLNANTSNFVTSKASRSGYFKFKAFLKAVYEEQLYLTAVAKLIADLQPKHKKCIIFANTKEEKIKLLKRIPMSCDLDVFRKTQDNRYVLVLTLKEGGQGLNLPEFNVVISRPQPGDSLEQMKGRIDRPQQREKLLELYLVYAQDTFEEVEVANIRLW